MRETDPAGRRKSVTEKENAYRTLMCHLTEIPPMRRIDLQPGTQADKNARRYTRIGVRSRVCGWLGQSVPICEMGGASSATRRRNVRISVAKFIYCRDHRERETQKGSQ